MPAQLNRAISGMLAGVAFGLAWNLIGAFSLGSQSRPAVLVVVCAVATILAVAIVRSATPRTNTSPVNRRWLAFSIFGEILFIIAGLLYCNLADRPGLILPLVGLAVGLHFLPMGKAYNTKLPIIIGILATSAALVSLACPVPIRSVVLCFGMGASIWTGIFLGLSTPRSIAS